MASIPKIKKAVECLGLIITGTSAFSIRPKSSLCALFPAEQPPYLVGLFAFYSIIKVLEV